jgi:hypothetical protein
MSCSDVVWLFGGVVPLMWSEATALISRPGTRRRQMDSASGHRGRFLGTDSLKDAHS